MSDVLALQEQRGKLYSDYYSNTIPSLEAAGIDVVRHSRDLGMTYNNGVDKVTCFDLVLYR